MATIPIFAIHIHNGQVLSLYLAKLLAGLVMHYGFSNNKVWEKSLEKQLNLLDAVCCIIMLTSLEFTTLYASSYASRNFDPVGISVSDYKYKKISYLVSWL